MRTLVVSDLHLGARTGRDVLRRAEVRKALVAEIARCDRLVLLGDAIELRQGPVRDALSASEAVFRELGAALGEGREVVLVPGNHDHSLLGGWLERRGRRGAPPPLGLSCPVDWRAGEALARIAGWLAPAEVRACYPGLWLREDVYATHGHYADRHTTVPMLERLGAGMMARVVGEAPAGPRCAEDYEATLAPLYAWIHAVAQTGGPSLGGSSHGASGQAWRVLSGADGRRRKLRRRALVAGFPALVAMMNRAGIGQLRADISGPELRRASLRAFGEVCTRLGVRAPYVIFGHSHRAGPLPGDDRPEWRFTGGMLINSGNWVYERQYLGGAPGQSPYWPGTCVVLSDVGEPELRSLLRDRGHEELAPAPQG